MNTPHSPSGRLTGLMIKVCSKTWRTILSCQCVDLQGATQDSVDAFSAQVCNNTIITLIRMFWGGGRGKTICIVFTEKHTCTCDTRAFMTT